VGAGSFEWLLCTTAARDGAWAEIRCFDSSSVYFVLIMALYNLPQTATPNHLDPGFTRRGWPPESYYLRPSAAPLVQLRPLHHRVDFRPFNFCTDSPSPHTQCRYSSIRYAPFWRLLSRPARLFLGQYLSPHSLSQQQIIGVLLRLHHQDLVLWTSSNAPQKATPAVISLARRVRWGSLTCSKERTLTWLNSELTHVRKH
jgi:hypothetical protein